MSTALYNLTVTTPQGTAQVQRTITSDGELTKNPELGPAKIGALTTRTSDTVGTLTMDTGHGISTGNRLDIYWTESGVKGSRYGVTVGTVAGDSVPFSLGAGSNLPSDETAITAMVPRLETFAYDKDDIVLFAAMCQAAQSTVIVRDVTPNNLVVAVMDGPTDCYVWDSASGVTTPFSADTVDVYLSHGDSSQAYPVIAEAFVN